MKATESFIPGTAASLASPRTEEWKLESNVSFDRHSYGAEQEGNIDIQTPDNGKDLETSLHTRFSGDCLGSYCTALYFLANVRS